ncbi:hypothetical protein HMPREF1985_00176 [Mitsuokella sp. oral taxon 131 str. W9106]|nr:hypothetical protein HMPREF1985_00176 [Mitsuokella sp. oral taxon 131 str. W9106]
MNLHSKFPTGTEKALLNSHAKGTNRAGSCLLSADQTGTMPY